MKVTIVKISTHSSIGSANKTTAHHQITPLELETRPTVDTAAYAHYMHIALQTARIHACKETGPIRPIRIPGSAKLHWSTAEIRRVLGVTSNQNGYSTLEILACIIGVALLLVLLAASDLFASLDWAGVAMAGAGVIRNRDSTSVCTNPDGNTIDLDHYTPTSTTRDGKPVSIPIGPCGLLLGDKREPLAAGKHSDVEPDATAPKGNGLDAANDQPAKTLTNYAKDFIANCTRFPSTSCGICVAVGMLLAKVVLTALWGTP